MWQQVIDTLQDEFSDLPDAAQWTRLLLRLGLAVLLGALIGYEREQRESAAGLRTHMLVALGTALFVLVPQQAGLSPADLSRVIQGVIAGVGFLGAGAVIKRAQSGEVQGLTTAAGIWATAAIGVAVGLGREATAIASTLIVVVILGLVLRLEKRAEAGRLRAAEPPPGN
ncbi:MAG: MgtC/SapB family protein [Burkholderiales bacterium]|nr:MgtC/SapB family protein [Burkholderiales bacterium]